MNKQLILFCLVCTVAVWVPPVSSLEGHLTKMKHFHFKDCSHETVLTAEMKAMIPPETEEVHLSSCDLIHSIPGHFCNGLSKLEGVVIVNITKITNKTFAGLDCVKYLSINFSNSKELTIEHGAFEGLKKLKRLYLNGISKSAIPEDLFDSHIQLVVDGVMMQDAAPDDDVTTVEADRTETPSESEVRSLEEPKDSGWATFGKVATGVIVVAIITAVVILVIWYVRRKLKGTNPDLAASETATQPDDGEGDASLEDNADKETESSLHTPEAHELVTLVVNDEINGGVVLLSSSVVFPKLNGNSVNSGNLINH